MISMTGYGCGEYRSDDYIISIEMKSYNNRYLEISHNISPLLSSFEEYVDKQIKSVALRGHIDFSMKLTSLKSSSVLSLDTFLLDEYIAIFDKIAQLSGSSKPSSYDYASLDGVVTALNNTDSSFYKEGVIKALEIALDMLKESKRRDGEGTKEDLKRLGNKFKASLDSILEKKDEMESYFWKILVEKYELLIGEIGKDDPRFLTEVAALLVKYSINEECSRLKVHLDRYFALLDSKEPVGKEIDFLCQEMNREINTIASKSQMVEINLSVVKMKDALEDIREQVRNIE